MRKDQGIRDTRARDTEDNIERDNLGDGSFTMKRIMSCQNQKAAQYGGISLERWHILVLGENGYPWSAVQVASCVIFHINESILK
jgi:hypothetical protein